MCAAVDFAGTMRPTFSAGYISEESQGGPQQEAEEAGSGLSRDRALGWLFWVVKDFWLITLDVLPYRMGS